MRFAHRVFLGESLKADPSKVIKKIKKRRFLSGTYVICPADNGIDPLEYYDARQLRQSYYDDKELDIVGLAGSEDEALDVVREIYEASVEYGHESIRSYVEELFS